MTQNSNRNYRIGPAGTLEVGNQPFTHQLAIPHRESPWNPDENVEFSQAVECDSRVRHRVCDSSATRRLVNHGWWRTGQQEPGAGITVDG